MTPSPRLAATLGAATLVLALAGCGGSSTGITDHPSPAPATSTSESTPGSTAGTPAPSASRTPSSPAPKDAVTRDEAGQVATARYGGTVIGIEADHYRGQAAWEVEIRDSSQGRIEVKVAKATGEILHLEHED